MAIKFSDFSHYSKYNGDLPGYDISGGEEVFDYWRSPYDPNLTYLHNIADYNDYFQNGTYGYGLYLADNTIGGGQGVRYPRFIHEGYFNDLYVERETGYPFLTGGEDLPGAVSYGYIPERPIVYGYAFAWWNNFDMIFSSDPAERAFTDLYQYPNRKKLVHGRLYLYYQGGTNNDPGYTNIYRGLNPANGVWETNAFYSGGAGVPQTGTSGQLMDWVNDPLIRVFDARYFPGSNESILRENETYEIEASPVVGQKDVGGIKGGPLSDYGLSVIPSTLPATNGSPTWGQYRQYCEVGHSRNWGRNFTVGNGMMMFMTALDTCEMWGINGEKTPFCHGTSSMYIDGIYPLHGGMYFSNPGGNDGSGKPPEEWIRPYGMQEAITLKHDKITVWTRQYASGSVYDLERGPSTYNNADHEIFVFNSTDSRIRFKVGHKTDPDAMQVYAVGNGRLYTIMFHENTKYTGDGYVNYGSGTMPYWYNTYYLRSNYSAEISTLSGVPRRKSFVVNGGSILNLSGGNLQGNPVKAGHIDRIAAGCGRVVYANTNYWQENEGNSNYDSRYGKAWLYTQDGAFIKTLSFKDEEWSVIGGAIGKANRFGFKMEIANNLIFIMAPGYDLSNWVTTDSGYQTWGGLGRMYIYSLDGELLAAFSGFNLGFTSSFPFNITDFCTDGVDLFLFNNQDAYYGENTDDFGKQGQGIIWISPGGSYYTDGTASLYNAGGSRVFARNRRPLIVHLKLPETLSNYYDRVVETYRY